MSKTYTLLFLDITKNDVNIVGGKGANLGEMARAGLPVPNGFCINVKAYNDFLEEAGIQPVIEEKLKTINWDNINEIEEQSKQIQKLMIKQNISSKLKNEILETYKNLCIDQMEDVPVAVRSSATAEDLPEASFAGQQETFLNILGSQEVIVHVKKCWASLWSARAMAYRQKNNFNHLSVYLAVVVQKMIKSELAGVAFSINPLSENENELLINAAYGLGEVVVSGLVTPDTFILNKKDGSTLQKQLGTKEKQLISTSNGQTELIQVQQNMQSDYSLTNSQLQELYALVTRVEKHYQFPQDIEWAFANGQLYLLQTRPVTTIGKKENHNIEIDFENLSKLQKWMLDDLIEHYPQAPSPLDYSVVEMSYQSVLNCVENLGLKSSPAEEIMKFEYNGKIRLNTPNVKFTLKLLKLPSALLKAAKVSANDWNNIKNEAEATVKRIETLDLSKQSNKQLLKEWDEIFRLAKLVTDLRFYYIIVASILPFAVLSLLIKKLNRNQQIITPIELITTGLDYQTVMIDRELHQLALFASKHGELKEAVLKNECKNLTRFQESLFQYPSGIEFLNKLQTFLNKYGYRTETMYQPFTSKAWLENSSEFLSILKAVLKDSHLKDRVGNENQRKIEHDQQVREFEQKFKGPFQKLFKWSLNRMREFYILREETVFHLEMLFTVGRKLASQFGTRLVQTGYLQASKDIIYLQKNEIPALLSGITGEHDIPQLVNNRRNHISANQMLWKQCLLKLSKQTLNGKEIEGITGSPGLAEGPVRVILSVKDFHKIEKGDILVCPYTDPTWTPLFGIAAAVVADTGGPLSHAAIVAREYEIPAILGTKIGTTLLKDGDQVIVDGLSGTSGKVYICK